MNRFAIHIATKNRRDELLLTLAKVASLPGDVECVVIDDGSTDGTFEAIKTAFPKVSIRRNAIPKGYIWCRNTMLNETLADYAISLDDDANFVTENPLPAIEAHFESHPKCGLVAFRIFWGKVLPGNTAHTESETRVKAFVGCGHVWRISAWRAIADYPEWFGFYGEEQFASLQLFHRHFEIDYLPQVLVHHRVDMQARKADTAGVKARFRNALRADWYNYFLFYPIPSAVGKTASSVKNQFVKVFKGNPQLALPLFGAVWDLIRHTPQILRQRNPLTKEAYRQYMKLPQAKIFWKA